MVNAEQATPPEGEVHYLSPSPVLESQRSRQGPTQQMLQNNTDYNPDRAVTCSDNAVGMAQ